MAKDKFGAVQFLFTIPIMNQKHQPVNSILLHFYAIGINIKHLQAVQAHSAAKNQLTH